jgi:hypothetical protein
MKLGVPLFLCRQLRRLSVFFHLRLPLTLTVDVLSHRTQMRKLARTFDY